MSAFYLLIGASFLAALIALAAFLWSVKDGQMEDTNAEAFRMLNDE